MPSRIAFYADTFYDSPHSPAYWIPPANLDVAAIVLGGDIHYRPEHLGGMVREIRETQRDDTLILVVPGNGEYVNQELNQASRDYRAAVAATPGAMWLDNEVAELPGGSRIIGSTLWSHVPDDWIGAYNAMFTDDGASGVDNISLGGRPLTIEDCNELHQQARSFLASQLRSLSAAQRATTIVCTHFWPTLRPFTSLDGQAPPELHIIGSDLDDLISECGPRLWLCGHAHTSHRVTIGGTEISSNPRAGDGPGNLNPEFAETCILEI